MDELYENLSLFVPAALGLYSLGVVHLTLSAIGWNGRSNIFAASWRSTVAVWITSAVVTFVFNDSLMFREVSGLALNLGLLFVANTCAIAGALAMTKRREIDSVGLLNSEINPSKRGSIWKTAAIVTVVTIVSFAGLLVAVGDIQNRYFPRPPVRFGIYDL